MQSTSRKTPGWMNHKLESRLQGEISTTSDATTLIQEREEELKSLLMRVNEESETAGLDSIFKKLRSWYPVPSLHGI